MQIQKGLVKYKDRSDIVCTYGLTEEGRQYYFLDNTSMSNGNIIASTVLVEAIDPVVVASSVGVIDANGTVVIPFENRSIKPVMDGLLLIEVANSTTPSVVEANSLKSDPLAATKLVTTPATIKDKINAKMGAEGRFVFNDQFSEATICDYSGNNILDNQYFSFIAIKNNETLYLSKNTVDSPVLEYSIPNRMFVAQNEVPLDVQNTEVTQETIDGAMNASEQQAVGFNADDITEKDFESVMDGAPVEEPLPVDPSVVDPNAVPVEPVESTEAPVEAPVEETEEPSEEGEEPESVIPAEINHEETVAPDVESAIAAAEASEEVPAEGTPSEEVTNTEINDDLPVEPSTVLPDEEVQENVVVEEPVEEAPVEEQTEEVPVEETPVEETPVEESVEEVADDKLMEFDFAEDNTSLDFDNDFESNEVALPEEDVVSDFKSDLFTDDLDSDIFADSTLQADKIDINDSFNDFGYKMPGAKDSIIEDVASTMSNLIRQNKQQKQVIASYEEKMDQAAAAYRKVVDKAKGQLRDVEVLKNKLKNYETIVTKLEAKLEVLENKVRDQDKVIASQTRELDSLRPQVEGKEELVKILADAQSLLDN
ncbi:MAG: hypothetical protein IJE53_04365 [Bacilli bacterium]|nr:hypothetical protein [Bacilli bacterium]